MIWPGSLTAPVANTDMPEDVKTDYEEAREILFSSPRGAAALLRLAIQKLCRHLGGKGENLNEDIGKLVEDGLPKKVQKALDAVRVIGNNAVHPGQIDINDDPDIADSLFDLVNLITQVMITEPKMVDEVYEHLPETAKEQIEKRDKK